MCEPKLRIIFDRVQRVSFVNDCQNISIDCDRKEKVSQNSWKHIDLTWTPMDKRNLLTFSSVVSQIINIQAPTN